MIEMTLADVLVQVRDDDPLRLADHQAIVVLREKDGDRMLPIWIGAPEGAAMAYHLTGGQPMRPMTSDLLVDLLRVTGGKVERVAVTELRDNVFYATIGVDGHEVDARPSDAINVAVRVAAPILVAEAVLDASARGEHAEPPEGDRWTSLSAELLAELHKPPALPPK